MSYKQILTTNDIGTGANQVATGNHNHNSLYPKKDGTGASGTWGINITGNAASASSVAWGNISGKPSSYTPSSHTHSYITNKGATVANTRTPDYTESLITGGWASADAGYGSTYGTTLDISGYSTWYHRLAFHTGGQIDYWMGINTKTLTKQSTLITSANYNNYAPTKTGGGASGTWGINISGNAASASSVAWPNVSGKPSTFTPSSHTHSVSQLTWAGSENLTCTGNSSEWSIDMSSGAPDSYFHIWSGYLGGTCMKFENRTGLCRAPYGVYGGVWNDYAEFRICNEDFKPGQVVLENGDDTLSIASQRLQRGCSIVSDTFGFAIGETESAKTPIAVSGRVLAYPYESREEFKKNIGRPVCSGPNGTVSIMTDEEYRDKGYCAIGTISAVPDYEEWGTGKVKVNGRVWIKVF